MGTRGLCIGLFPFTIHLTSKPSTLYTPALVVCVCTVHICMDTHTHTHTRVWNQEILTAPKSSTKKENYILVASSGVEVLKQMYCWCFCGFGLCSVSRYVFVTLV